MKLRRNSIVQSIVFLILCMVMFAHPMKVQAEAAGNRSTPDSVEEYYYTQLTDAQQEVYRELYTKVMNNEDSGELDSRVSVDDFFLARNRMMDDHPEIFWYGGWYGGTSYECNEESGYVESYEFEVTVPVEWRAEMTLQLEAAADAIIGLVPEDATEYEKIKTVYEILIRLLGYNDDDNYYNNNDNNNNIQGALLYHQSVCVGYSRAMEYILHRMGIFCIYEGGFVNPDADLEAGEDDGPHAWNIVRIGDEYYNVDVTWGDVSDTGGNDPDQEVDYYYLCCTDADLGERVPDDGYVVPACTDESYNYFRLNGMYYDTFDYDEIHDVLMDAVRNDQDSISMKFGTQDAYQAAYAELIEGSLLDDPLGYFMEINEVESCSIGYGKYDESNVIEISW